MALERFAIWNAFFSYIHKGNFFIYWTNVNLFASGYPYKMVNFGPTM